jgi:hypothetical protein
MNRDEMFAIDEVQLREIKDRYNIPGGTNQYFPLGHESGLGGLVVYFPKGSYGTKDQKSEDLRRALGASREDWVVVNKRLSEREALLSEEDAVKKWGRARAKRELAFLVSTTMSQPPCQQLDEIQQVDVSTHLPDYPGSEWHLFGCVLSVPRTEAADSLCEPIIFLFRGRSLATAQKTAALLQSTKWRLEELQPRLLGNWHPVQIAPAVGSLCITAHSRQAACK